MVRVYTGGTFDLFHAGHVNFLREASRLGDELIVALNTDDFVEKFKRKTICNYDERFACLKACRYVHWVVDNFGGENSGLTIDSVKPNIIAIGDDWQDKDYLGQLGIDQKFLDDRNIVIQYIPYTKTISTTEIIKRIKNA